LGYPSAPESNISEAPHTRIPRPFKPSWVDILKSKERREKREGEGMMLLGQPITSEYVWGGELLRFLELGCPRVISLQKITFQIDENK